MGGKKHKGNKAAFIEKLKRVIVYRIEVPEHTDLNRYFEIMNTRGEQLEQHDILKASLMSFLSKEEQAVFAKIWDACSDMTGYVQMHFVSKNNEVREKIFGSEWNSLPPKEWEKYKIAIGKRGEKGTGYKISDIINSSFTVRMVVYQALYGERGIWVRPASMWNEPVERGGKTYKRFEYIEG